MFTIILDGNRTIEFGEFESIEMAQELLKYKGWEQINLNNFIVRTRYRSYSAQIIRANERKPHTDLPTRSNHSSNPHDDEIIL